MGPILSLQALSFLPFCIDSPCGNEVLNETHLEFVLEEMYHYIYVVFFVFAVLLVFVYVFVADYCVELLLFVLVLCKRTLWPTTETTLMVLKL